VAMIAKSSGDAGGSASSPRVTPSPPDSIKNCAYPKASRFPLTEDAHFCPSLSFQMQETVNYNVERYLLFNTR